jgi:hypothetical protein
MFVLCSISLLSMPYGRDAKHILTALMHSFLTTYDTITFCTEHSSPLNNLLPKNTTNIPHSGVNICEIY